VLFPGVNVVSRIQMAVAASRATVSHGAQEAGRESRKLG